MNDWLERLRSMEPEEMQRRTLAELCGADRLLVEHHRGILAYGSECIRIGATFGQLLVEGEGLRLCCMSRAQLVIRGRIRGLRLEVGE